ncbi:DnaJ C-terminal domain-containing protein [Anabaena catenula]|uniref:Chaperone DnaJ C-terminal domain-containing protein n=1 Tax=Anabaena catenula FACHB-362 TaxID=2692877 RepID=A0ABR8J7X3_9NOST|nr:DnaJ C-terminal domain-containing protein [Anabaena catenula]MBD2693663.1 hypothetical protein [Anabaena catenula FACHB-362]
MIFQVFPWMYALLFVILILAYPFYLVDNPGLFVLCLVGNTSLFLAVAWFTNSRELSFWRGLRLLCASFSSGCANITIFYIIPVLLFYYVRMIVATCVGFRRGKVYTENWWMKTISERYQSQNSWNILEERSATHPGTSIEADALGNLKLNLNLGFYEAIFGCEKEIQFNHLEAKPDGNVMPVTRTLQISVPAGVKPGTRLLLSGEGDVNENGEKPGDLYVYLAMPLEEESLKRDGINIVSEIRITAAQAQIGTELSVNTIDGETKMMIPAGIRNGSYLTLAGHGVPKLGSPSERGDHMIRVVY